MNASNMIALARKAARVVYGTQKYANRGEFGELLLHIVMRQVHDSIPAISKLYYKSALNETVKGFDAVHVVHSFGGLELWLGEAKFYSSASVAIRELTDELRNHTEVDYLRDEFLLISNKIDPNWPHAEDLQSLIHPNVSLDAVFKRVCIPALITYDSPSLNVYKSDPTAYRRNLEKEVRKYRDLFTAKAQSLPVVVQLCLIPLNTKERLVQELHELLLKWQDR